MREVGGVRRRLTRPSAA